MAALAPTLTLLSSQKKEGERVRTFLFKGSVQKSHLPLHLQYSFTFLWPRLSQLAIIGDGGWEMQSLFHIAQPRIREYVWYRGRMWQSLPHPAKVTSKLSLEDGGVNRKSLRPGGSPSTGCCHTNLTYPAQGYGIPLRYLDSGNKAPPFLLSL